MVHAENATRLARMLKLIADETRLRILGLLAERERNGRELAEVLQLTPPTISHHMRKLVDAGLVVARPEAQQQIYSLNTRLLAAARELPLAPPGETRAVADEADRLRNRVLANFFEGSRLKTIPARRKDRVIVLQHLLERFDPSRSYPEQEVNDILRVAHEDVATLRRELVDYGYMERERGVYRIARHPPARSRQVAQEIPGDEMAWLGRLLTGALNNRSSDDRSGGRVAEP